MADLPEQQKDNLEAYPLRLNVSALPERRFFKMTRTLTVSVVLLASLLIALGVFLNYQITHLDVTIKRGSAWQFYRIDPEAKQLKVTEPSVLVIDPLRLATEERLLAYLKIRNSTVWTQDTMDRNFGPAGPIAQLSNPKIYMQFDREAKAMLNKTRGAGLIREAHIYSLKWLLLKPLIYQLQTIWYLFVPAQITHTNVFNAKLTTPKIANEKKSGCALLLIVLKPGKIPWESALMNISQSMYPFTMTQPIGIYHLIYNQIFNYIFSGTFNPNISAQINATFNVYFSKFKRLFFV